MSADSRLPVVMVASTDFDGGAEKYVARLAAGLHARGWAVRLVGRLAPWPAHLPHDDIGLGPKWSLRNLPMGLACMWGERRATRAAIDEESLFILHFKREQIALSDLTARRGPVVWVEHGTFPPGIFGRLIGPAYRLASRRAELVICVSDVVARSIERRVAKSTPVVVIDTGVSRCAGPAGDEAGSTEAIAARRRLGLPLDVAIVCVVGRLTASKRPALAIEAALEAGVDVAVAGSGPEGARLRQRYRTHPMVHLLGHIKDVDDVFRSSAVHVFASDGAGEGAPTVLLEAAALGVPSVGASGTGFESMVCATGGNCVEPTPAALARLIRTTLADEAAPMRARAFAATRTEESWLRQFEATLRQTTALRAERSIRSRS